MLALAQKENEKICTERKKKMGASGGAQRMT